MRSLDGGIVREQSVKLYPPLASAGMLRIAHLPSVSRLLKWARKWEMLGPHFALL